MRDELLHYYERELSFIRRSAGDFAERYPEVASRLSLEANRCEDPHVERLIESFAMLAARIQMRLSDDFADVSEALLGVLYPHYLCPVPSMSIVQLSADPASIPPTGLSVDKNASLYSRPVNDVRCRFRTTQPVTLWPIEVESVEVVTTTALGSELPVEARAALRIRLKTSDGTPFSDVPIDCLRFFLDAESGVLNRIYELFLRDPRGLAIQSGPGTPAFVLPAEFVRPVGFKRDEGMLVYPEESFLGYRLLQEYFSFPEKFMFVELAGLEQHLPRINSDHVDISVLLDETVGEIDLRIAPEQLQLGCTPVINLFEHEADPIRMTHTSVEYPVIPDNRSPHAFEVYSILDVSSTAIGSSDVVRYDPIYRLRHGIGESEATAFWSGSRRQSIRKGDAGTDFYLSLIDENFDPMLPPSEVLHVKALCSNRSLPSRLPFGDPNGDFDLEGYPSVTRVCCLRKPTPPLPPPSGASSRWRIVSHLALNYLSITEDDAHRGSGRAHRGLDALREILKLYDFADSPVTRQRIAGLTSLESRRVVRRMGSGPESGFARGLEVGLTFDSNKYTGTGLFLFASVLEVFLGLYCSINSFNQMVARCQHREGVLKRWPPRAGEKQLL